MFLEKVVGYFESPDSLSFTLHVISAVSIPIHCFGMYLIMFRTPESMKIMKWYLLSLHVSTVLFDYSISLAIIPVIFFPEFAGYPLGWVRLLDVKYYVFVVVIGLFFLACKFICSSFCKTRFCSSRISIHHCIIRKSIWHTLLIPNVVAMEA